MSATGVRPGIALSREPGESPLSVTNRRGEKLAGILRVPVPSSGDRLLRKKKIALLCHGFLSHKDFFLLQACARGLDATGENEGCEFASYRFDLSGNGQSEGKFRGLGGYKKDLEDVEDVVTYWRSAAEEVDVVALLGHSKGASTALHYALRHDDIPFIVSLSARHDMSRGLRERLGDDKMDELSILGETSYYEKTTKRTISITSSEIEERMAVDNSGINASNIHRSKVLLVHGSRDTVIPLEDSSAFKEQLKDRAELVVVDGAGHNFAPPHHKKVVEALKSFLIAAP